MPSLLSPLGADTKVARPSSSLTMMTGAAGSGKSKAMEIAAGAEAGPFIQVRAEARQHGFASFARAIADAAGAYVPAIAVGFATAYATARRGMQPPALLGEWFGRHLGAHRLVIALDDLHLVDERPDMVEFVTTAIASADPSIQWILAVRDLRHWDPARFEAEGVSVRHRTFHAAGDPCEDDAVIALHARVFLDSLDDAQRTTLRILAAMPSLDRGDLEDFARASDLLERLGPRFGRFRCGTRMRAPLIEAISTDSRVDDVDAALRANLAFALTPVADRIRVFAKLGAKRLLAEALEADGFALIDAHFGDVVDGVLGELTAVERHASALALLSDATRATERGQHDVAEAWYLHAARIATDDASRARVEFQYGSDLLRRSRPDCVEILERVGSVTVATGFDALVSAALAAAYASSGDTPRALAAIERAAGAIDAWHDADPAIRARVDRQAAYIYLRAADPFAAAKSAHRAIAVAEFAGLDEIVATALSILVNIATAFDDDSEAALVHLARLELCAKRLDNTFWLRYARLSRLEAYGDRGAWREVDALERLLRSNELANDVLHTDETLMRTRALRAAATGDFQGALRILEVSGGLTSEPDLRIFHLAEIATYAAGAGEYRRAQTAIAAADLALATTPVNARALRVRSEVQLALAQHVLGDRTRARARIRRQRSAVRPFRRLSALADAVECVCSFDEYDADSSSAAMLDALAHLRSSGFGGVADVIGSLPLATLERRAS